MTAMFCKKQGMHFVLHIPEPTIKQESTCMKQFVRYILSEPEYLEAILYHADVKVDRALFKTLGDVVDLAIMEKPAFADLHYYGGFISFKLGDLIKSQQLIRRAVSINPRYIKARMMLAELCAAEENEFEAVEHLKIAIAN